MATKKTSEWINSNLGRKQREDLFDRIGAVKSIGWRYEREKEPASVVSARKTIEIYEKREHATRQKLQKAVEGPCAKARSAVLFAATPNAALAVVEALEAHAKKNGWLKNRS